MSTLERINNCLEELFGQKAENEDQSFQDDLELDSLDWLELSIRLEGEFGIEIPEQDYSDGQIKTVKQAVDYIDKALAQ